MFFVSQRTGWKSSHQSQSTVRGKRTFWGARSLDRILQAKGNLNRRLAVESLEDRCMLSVAISGIPDWVAEGPGPTLDGQVRNVASPSPLGDDPVTGAIHTVLADPTDADTLFLGAANGGIWRTTDATSGGGPTWEPLLDQFGSLSIGAMAFDDADLTSQTIVAGIGHFSSWSRIGGPLNGLLRTTDGGDTWNPLGVDDLAGRNISGVYARGDLIVVSANNFGGGTSGGVYQSTDGGETFGFISGTGNLSAGAAFDLVVDPTLNSRLYVSVDDIGLFRSDNDGTDWTNVSQNDPAGLEAAIQTGSNNNIEMAVSPISGRIFVGVVDSGRPSYIGYSDNLGGNWAQMDLPVSLEGVVAVGNVSSLSTAPGQIIVTSVGHGINNGQRVRVTGVTGNTAANGEFTITATDPDGNGPLTSSDGFILDGAVPNGEYAGGGSYQQLVGLSPREKPGGQGGIHFSILVDPADDGTVYIGGDRQDAAPNAIGAVTSSGRLFRGDASIAPVAPGDPTNEFSPQWEHLTDDQNAGFAGGGTASGSAPHADSREMVFDAAGDLIETDDGGIYRRSSPGDNTGDWFSLMGNLQTAEFHDIAYDPISGIILGGAQDTGTPEQISPGGFTWDSVSTADGGDVAVDALIGGGQSLRYTNTQNLGTFRRRVFDAANSQVGAAVTPALNILAGGNPIGVQFVTPVVTNNVASDRLIIGGSNSTYESLDRGDNLTEIGPGIGVNAAGGGDRDGSPVDYGGMQGGAANPDVLYIGSGSQVFLRTASGGPLIATGPLAGANNIQAVKMHPDDWSVAYATDGTRVYQTSNAGTNWANITGDLTDTLLRTVEIVTNGIADAILVGGASGVHRMLSGALGMWSELGMGLPNAPVSDLDYDAGDDFLVAGTLGRGAWSLSNVQDVIFDKGVLQIDGDMDFAGQDDTIRLVRAANNPLLLQVIVNGVEVAESPLQLDTIQQINVNGLGGNDTLIVDSTNGLVTVDMGIRYDGGLGDDQLQLSQTDGDLQTSETITVGATVGSGIDTILGPTGTQVVEFENLEPILTNVPVGSLDIDGALIGSLLHEDNQITYDQSDLMGVDWGRITVDAFEPIHFTAKGVVTIDTENGDDVVVLDNANLPTDLIQLQVLGDDGEDIVNLLALPDSSATTFGSVQVLGGPGNDTIDGSAILVDTPLTLIGNEGNDLLLGGAGGDLLDGSEGDDQLRGGSGDNTLGGGPGLDTIFLAGTSGNDTVDLFQSAGNTLQTTFNGNVRTDQISDMERIVVELGSGDDIIQARHADLLAGSLPVEIVGGPPNASDILAVVDEGLGDTVIQRLGTDGQSGSITVGSLAPITYSQIESVYVTPINPITAGTGSDGLGRLVIFKNDPFESNNTLPAATFLGAGASVNVDPTIDPGGIDLFNIPGDNDFYKFVAAETGTLDFQVYFDEVSTLANGRPGLPGDGALNVELYDSDGLPASIGTGTPLIDPAGNTIGRQVAIPVVRNETYTMRVVGATASAVNVYNFTVLNVPAPIPQVVDLQAATDSGRNNTDDSTFFDANLHGASVFDIVLDDDRMDEFTNLDLQPDTNDDDQPTIGFDYGVEVFNNGSSIGYAFYVSDNLWRFTATSGDLNEGDNNFISTALWLRDPADPAVLGRAELSLPLQLTLDTIVPSVNFGIPTDSDGLADDSDTGVLTMPMTFTDRITSDTTPHLLGQAEADAIIKVYADLDQNGTIDPDDPLLGETVSIPLDGNLAEPQGFWELTSVVDLNDPSLFASRDGLRQLLVSAEDVAGNVNLPDDGVADGLQVLELFIDTQGPQVLDVTVTDTPAYDLFDPKPAENGPTPLVSSITIDFVDQPNRLGPDFLYDALKADIATNPGNYLLVGDHVGVIAIDTVAIAAAPVVDGAPASASIILTFVAPLPDDRFTLTISDNLVDPVGNRLDGESNAEEPLEDPLFPSGDGLPGGLFEARFTIDTRPEIGSYVSQDIDLDINGNFVWDPANGQIGNDTTNVDLAFTLPVANPDGSIGQGGFNVHDLLFAGQFVPFEEPNGENGGANGERWFDQLAAYGNSAELDGFRWIIDTNSDGVVNPVAGDILTLQPELEDFNVAGAIPLAGNFDGNADNGDEVVLYNFGTWLLDTDRDFMIETNGDDTRVDGTLLGLPIVGDFDGDGLDDLAVFNNNTFTFDLAADGFGMDDLDGDLDDTFIWGFPGVLDRPVAADMDQDGIDDIGLWVPRDSASLPQGVAEWYFLLSGDFIAPGGAGIRITGSVNTLNHPFEPVPFGNDLFAEFGDERSQPIVGNFDPPVARQSVPDPNDQNVQETADFDSDGDVDGFDFLAWQRGYGGTEASLTDGDANADGTVDENDLSAWQAAFDTTIAAQTASALAEPAAGESDLVRWQVNFGVDSGALSSEGDASSDGDVDGGDFLAWQLAVGTTPTQSIVLAREGEALVALLATEPASSDRAGTQDFSATDVLVEQNALAWLNGLEAKSLQIDAHRAAADEVFQRWFPRDLSRTAPRWLPGDWHAGHETHSYRQLATHLSRSHEANARDIALADDADLASNRFSPERLWRE